MYLFENRRTLHFRKEPTEKVIADIFMFTLWDIVHLAPTIIQRQATVRMGDYEWNSASSSAGRRFRSQEGGKRDEPAQFPPRGQRRARLRLDPPMISMPIVVSRSARWPKTIQPSSVAQTNWT